MKYIENKYVEKCKNYIIHFIEFETKMKCLGYLVVSLYPSKVNLSGIRYLHLDLRLSKRFILF